MIIALACIFVIILFGFTIAFLIDWIQSRKKIRKYLKYGVWVGLTIIGLDLIIVIFGLFSGNYMILTVLLAEPIVFVRLIGFTMLGMYYAAELGHPSFPLLLKKIKPSVAELPAENESKIEAFETEVEKYDSDSILVPDVNKPETLPVVDVLLSIPLKKYLIQVLGGAAICIIYTAILFLITKPHMSDLMQNRIGLATPNTENSITIQSILALIELSIAEEITFRLGIQNYLAKHFKWQNKKYWIAIVITSAIWTLGHAGVMDPQWVKFAQIFPIGLLLGWMNKKLGVESTIIVHVIMNLALTPLVGYLIG